MAAEGGSSLVARLGEGVSTWNRRRKAGFVSRFIAEHGIGTVLLVGVGGGWAPRWMVVEQAAASAARWAAACDMWERSQVPWPYVRASGLSLPFGDGAFDLVLSNAVVEHVGDEAHQRQFVAEHTRVGRHWIITTPNRWFPVETHTLKPVLHWSPRWRESRPEFTRLLSRSEFRALLPPGSHVVGRPYEPTFIGASALPG